MSGECWCDSAQNMSYLPLTSTTARDVSERLTFCVVRKVWTVPRVLGFVPCRRERTYVVRRSRSLWRTWFLENCHATSSSLTLPFSRRPKQPPLHSSCILAFSITIKTTHHSTYFLEPRTNTSWSSITTPLASANPRPRASPATLP